jgi:hypothetical protein
MKQFRDSRYWVSEDGEVFSYFPTKHNFYSGRSLPYITEEKWKVKKTYYNRGYEIISLLIDNKRTNFQIHRLVAELYIPGYFKGAHVDHIDCNILNNHYTNLQWCTKEYNVKKGSNPTFPLYSEWNK